MNKVLAYLRDYPFMIMLSAKLKVLLKFAFLTIQFGYFLKLFLLLLLVRFLSDQFVYLLIFVFLLLIVFKADLNYKYLGLIFCKFNLLLMKLLWIHFKNFMNQYFKKCKMCPCQLCSKPPTNSDIRPGSIEQEFGRLP